MSQTAVITRVFSVLEAVGGSGSATARQVAERLEIPLPTVYRLLNELVEAGYLTHLRQEGRFELGPKVFDLGLSFRQRLIAPSPIRQATDDLHHSLGAAAYFAVYRGSDILLTYLSDCQTHPRLRPLRFGFHEAAHATAFGKILLSGMPEAQRASYLDARGVFQLTAQTIVDRHVLGTHLEEVSTRGIAWEREEFLPRQTCAAVGIRNAQGMNVGALAISMPSRESLGREHDVESTLREYAGRCSRYMRAAT